MGPSLLGHDWLRKIWLTWAEIHLLTTAYTTSDQVLTKQSSLFKEELGTIKGVTAKTSPLPPPLHVHSDQRLIKQALENLKAAS